MRLFDVVVVGGGSAGVAAAVSAARAGARTLLLERSLKLGGNVAHALVHTICGLYRITDGPEVRYANGGFAKEVAERLLKGNGGSRIVRMGALDVLLQEPKEFGELLCRMVAGEPNLEVCFGAELGEVIVEGQCIQSVSDGGCGEAWGGAVFIDATGDVGLVRAAGGAVERVDSRDLQRPAVIFGIGGVDASGVTESGRLLGVRKMSQAIRAGRLSPALGGVTLRPTWIGGNVRATIDLAAGGGEYDPVNEEILLELLKTGEVLAEELIEFLKREVRGFERVEIVEKPSRVGVRESFRGIGRYQISEADILSGATFSDAVCISAWPIELRENATGPRWGFPEEGRVCEVPLRALMARDFGNLLVAGRCVSSDHRAQGALRVIGTGLAMGEAAGLAAVEIGRLGDGLEEGGIREVAARIFQRTSLGRE